MASLIINRDGFKLDELELAHGELSVGRKDTNDITLEDSAVSGQHAKIVTFFNASYIEDQGSTNGTYVNGQQVQKHALHNGDVVTLGGYQLMFTAKEQPQPDTSPAATMMLDKADLDKLMEESRDTSSKKPNAHVQTAPVPKADHAKNNTKAEQGNVSQQLKSEKEKPEIYIPDAGAERALQFLRDRGQMSTSAEAQEGRLNSPVNDESPVTHVVANKKVVADRSPDIKKPAVKEWAPEVEGLSISPLFKGLLAVVAVAVVVLLFLVVQRL